MERNNLGYFLQPHHSRFQAASSASDTLTFRNPVFLGLPGIAGALLNLGYCSIFDIKIYMSGLELYICADIPIERTNIPCKKVIRKPDWALSNFDAARY